MLVSEHTVFKSMGWLKLPREYILLKNKINMQMETYAVAIFKNPVKTVLKQYRRQRRNDH